MDEAVPQILVYVQTLVVVNMTTLTGGAWCGVALRPRVSGDDRQTSAIRDLCLKMICLKERSPNEVPNGQRRALAAG
jgi:hypothetical protein